jgi:hypothetical protein
MISSVESFSMESLEAILQIPKNNINPEYSICQQIGKKSAITCLDKTIFGAHTDAYFYFFLKISAIII